MVRGGILVKTYNTILYMTLALSIDLGQTQNYSTQQNKTNASNSRIIGVIGNYNKMRNQPFYLNTKPRNNSFSVKILDENNTISATEIEYVLTLHLEKIK